MRLTRSKVQSVVPVWDIVMSVLRPARAVAIVIGLLAAATGSGHAQHRLSLHAESIFYGDNTEFRNPFREGETVFGAAVRLSGDVDLDDRVRLSLGVFANQRFGDDEAFDLVRPVVALTVRGNRSAFVFGTLAMPRIGDAHGPDRAGPHRLLPPLQRETLAFERPYEAGLAWMFAGTRFQHDLWVNWQRVNTPEHRERFDAGATGEVRLATRMALPFQFHVVHEGGQTFSTGPVADSAALAVGTLVHGPSGPFDSLALEVYGLVSRFVPDRAAPERSRDGAGFFGRVSAEQSGWRGHVIFWRGDDFIKEEGDPNYLSIRRDGTRYRGIRDYAEAGVTRTFRLTEGVVMQASGRLHRVERHYEYSFRIVAVAEVRWPVR